MYKTKHWERGGCSLINSPLDLLTNVVQVLQCWGYFHSKNKESKTFENNLNTTLLVFIASLSTIRWVPVSQGFGQFSVFLHHLALAKYATRLGMGIVENSTVRFSSRFCFYGSVLSRFPKRYINDVSWIRNYAMECVAELAWTGKFLYTSSLATFSTLRRLLSIVKVGRVPDLRDFEMAVWLSRLADIVRPARR